MAAAAPTLGRSGEERNASFPERPRNFALQEETGEEDDADSIQLIFPPFCSHLTKTAFAAGLQAFF